MKNYGLFRIMTYAPEVLPGDTGFCTENIKKAVDLAVSKEASLLLLPELCVTGASCGDLFLSDSLLLKAEERAVEIADYTEGRDILLCFSFPVSLNGSVYSTAVIASDGRIIGAVPLEKRGRNVFSEYRGELSEIRIGNETVPFGKDIIFRSIDNKYLSISIGGCSGASVSLYPDAALASVNSKNRTEGWITAESAKTQKVAVYCSAGAGESSADGVYSGQAIVAECGDVLAEAMPFADGFALADVDLQAVDYRRRRLGINADNTCGNDVFFSLKEKTHAHPERPVRMLPFVPDDENDLHERCHIAMEIQARGLAERLKKTGIERAVLGISGGLDSTLALLVSVRAMQILDRPAEDVIAISMPCFGTSSRTKSNAQRMCEMLGVDFRLIDISEAVRVHLDEIGHDGTTADTAYENAQARERTQVLMDISNMENGLVVGTGDMSEAALGWCTFNGDHMSMYNVNCSVPKTFIRAIVSDYAARCGNDELGSVLNDVVATPISPELKPAVDGQIAQKTEEIIGPYDAHDFFLYHFIRNGSGPEKILFLAETAFRGEYTREQIKGWLKIFFRRFFSSQFKRNCVPEGPAVGCVNLSFSGGWYMPGDISAGTVMEELNSIEQ